MKKILALIALLLLMTFAFENIIRNRVLEGKNGIRYLNEIKTPLVPDFVEKLDSQTLILASKESNKIVFVSTRGAVRKSFSLNTFEEVKGIAKIDGGKIAVMLGSGVYIYDANGMQLDRIVFKEDGKTPLFPSSILVTRDRLYLGDEASRAVFALSLTEIYAKTARNEVVTITMKFEILALFPSDFNFEKPNGHLKKPVSICLSPDGRVFVGDARLNEIKVYSCNGRYLYSFEKVERMVPVSIEYDDKPGSVNIPKDVYDPAGTDKHGGVHVCDNKNSKVHVFTTMGKYLFSYGEKHLEGPTDIAIDNEKNLIYVAEPKKKALVVFSYKQ